MADFKEFVTDLADITPFRVVYQYTFEIFQKGLFET